LPIKSKIFINEVPNNNFQKTDKFQIPTDWKKHWEDIPPEDYPLVMLEYNLVLLNEIDQMQKTMNTIKNGVNFFIIVTVIGLLLGFCSQL